MITPELILTILLNASLFVVVLALCLRHRRQDLEHTRRMLWIERQLQRPGHSCSRCDPTYPFRAAHFDRPCPYEKGPRG